MIPVDGAGDFDRLVDLSDRQLDALQREVRLRHDDKTVDATWVGSAQTRVIETDRLHGQLHSLPVPARVAGSNQPAYGGNPPSASSPDQTLRRTFPKL